MLERCPLCPSRSKPVEDQKFVVPGDGPDDARVMFVGEGPGIEENNRHRCFVGKTGEECNNLYMPLAGCSRSESYFTNTCKCHWADSGDAPPDDVARSCAEFHLAKELERIQPEVVVLMGGTANNLMGWDVEVEHGVWHVGQQLLGWKGTIYSTFHPALGLHQSSKMQALLDDFRDLRLYLRGQLEPIRDEYPEPHYARIRTAKQVDDILWHSWQSKPLACDTESIKRWNGYRSGIRYTHFCSTFCTDPGVAFLISVEDEDATKRLGYWLNRYRRLLFQNFPHDQRVFMQSGIDVPIRHVFDTMSGAYHEGRIPKGLKAMAYKLCGIAGESFDDIVEPYGYERALDWLLKAVTQRWPKPVQERTGDIGMRNCPTCAGKGKISNGKRGKKREVWACDGGMAVDGEQYPCIGGKVIVPRMTRKQSLNDKLYRLVTDLQKGPVKIWERWEGWEQDVQPMIDRLGPIPVPSIDYVPESIILKYAAGDADKTRRVYEPLKARLVAIRQKVRGW